MVATLAVGLAVTSARAARFPNSFAQAHWIIDYRFGFIKRGLAGEVMSVLVSLHLLPRDANAIAGMSFAIFATFCAALLFVAARISVRTGGSAGALLPLAAFVTSPFIVTTAHLMGYLDHIIFTLGLGSLWLVLKGRSTAAACLCSIAVMVHESFVVLGLPLVVLAAAMRRPSGRSSRSVLCPFLLPVVTFAALVVFEAVLMDRERMRGHLVARLSRFHFVEGDMNIFVPEWLTTTMAQFVREQAPAFPHRVLDPGFLWRIVPTALSLALLALSALDSRRRRWLVPMALTIAAPLLMHLIAWDTARIWSYPLFVTLGCAWVCCETESATKARGLTVAGLVACVVVVLNILNRYPLLDNEIDRFSDIERLLLYAPFVAGCVLLVSRSVRRRPTPP